MNADNQPIFFFICVCTALFLLFLVFLDCNMYDQKATDSLALCALVKYVQRFFYFFANLLLFDSSVVPVICSIVFLALVC